MRTLTSLINVGMGDMPHYVRFILGSLSGAHQVAMGSKHGWTQKGTQLGAMGKLSPKGLGPC
jgi:hypothetical protein